MRTVLMSLAVLAATPLAAQTIPTDGSLVEAPQTSIAVPVPVIVVTSEGRIMKAPDMATVSAGVTTEAETAAQALADNSKSMDEVFALLKSAGIAEEDIQTSNLSINPVWNNTDSSVSMPKIGGYQATNMVTVQVRDLPKLGSVLDSVVSSGANQLNSLTFGLSDPAPAMDDARKMAVDEATRRAKLLASAAGVTVGPVLSITEGSGQQDPFPPMYRMEMAKSDVPVAGGQVSSSVTVTVTFGIVN